MAISAAQLVAHVAVTGVKQATGDLQSMSGAVEGVGGLMGGLLIGAAAAAATALITVGAKSVQMAGDYEQAMNKVKALTGSSTVQMAQYDAGLKQLAIDAGVAPTKLVDGLYNVISAGYQGRDAMKVFTLATEDSKIGMTSADTATSALTKVMADFKIKVSDAARANGIMLETVTLGNSTFPQYASQVTRAASVAAQFHVTLQTMSAAWATMTAKGLNAKQATTDFGAVVTTMYGKVETMAKSLAKSGIAFDTAKFNAMSFADKIKYMSQELDLATRKHVQITGVTKQAAEAITKLSQNMSTYNKDLATLSDKQAMAQKTQQAWATTQAGFNQQVSRLGAAFQVLLIDIGQKLLPILTQLISQITPLVVAFTSWTTSGKAASDIMAVFHSIMQKIQPTLTLIGNFLVSTFLPVWQQLVDTFKTQLKPAIDDLMTSIKPLMPTLKELAIGYVAVLIIELVLLIKTFAQVLIIVVKVFGDIVQIISGAISTIAGLVAFISDLMTGKFSRLGNDLRAIWTGISNMIIGIWRGLADTAFGWAQNMIQGFINGINSMVGGVGAAVSNLLSGVNLPGHASGIVNSPTSHFAMVGEQGPEMLFIPQGASIIPRNQVSSYASGGNQPLNVNVYLDGARLTGKLMPHIAQAIRYGVGAHGM